MAPPVPSFQTGAGDSSGRTAAFHAAVRQFSAHRPRSKFAFLAAKGAAFTGVKGQIHWFQENPAGTANDKTMVEGDINGDKHADFAIELKGLISLSAADFVL